jgi:hypothetical protein
MVELAEVAVIAVLSALRWRSPAGKRHNKEKAWHCTVRPRSKVSRPCSPGEPRCDLAEQGFPSAQHKPGPASAPWRQTHREPSDGRLALPPADAQNGVHAEHGVRAEHGFAMTP